MSKEKMKMITKSELEKDAYEFLNNITKEIIDFILKQEMEYFLGYDKYIHGKVIENNYRNGCYYKKAKTNFGKVKLSIPRDRKAIFEPKLVPKFQYDVSTIQSNLVNFYSKDISTEDIAKTLKNIYKVDVDYDFLNNLSNKLLVKINEFKNKQLEKTYDIVSIIEATLNSKDEGDHKEESIYIIPGYLSNKQSEILYIFKKESNESNLLVNILDNLKSKGIEKINLLVTNNLGDITEPIKLTFPETKIEKI